MTHRLEGGGLLMTKLGGGDRRSLIKTPGSLGRDHSLTNPGRATRGRGLAEPKQARPALRRTACMEPAAGFLSPRPFPRAAAPPAPPAGPGPPGNALPGHDLEMPAGPPAPDSGRLITDPHSGRTYFKGRLLGKVNWWGGVLARLLGGSVLPTFLKAPAGAGALVLSAGTRGRLSSARGRLPSVRGHLRARLGCPGAP